MPRLWKITDKFREQGRGSQFNGELLGEGGGNKQMVLWEKLGVQSMEALYGLSCYLLIGWAVLGWSSLVSSLLDSKVGKPFSVRCRHVSFPICRKWPCMAGMRAPPTNLQTPILVEVFFIHSTVSSHWGLWFQQMNFGRTHSVHLNDIK